MRQRIDSIDRAIKMLQTSDLFELFANYQTELDNDRNLFDEMAVKLDQQIANRERELAPQLREQGVLSQTGSSVGVSVSSLMTEAEEI